MVEWGIEGHTNMDKDIIKKVLGKQVYHILIMTCASVDKLERKKKRLPSVYTSPRLNNLGPRRLVLLGRGKRRRKALKVQKREETRGKKKVATVTSVRVTTMTLMCPFNFNKIT